MFHLFLIYVYSLYSYMIFLKVKEQVERRKFSSTIINYLGQILPSDSWDRFQISSSNEGLSCEQCGNVDQLDISILQTRVHAAAHYFLQGGKSPQRWQVWSKGDLFLKPLHMTILYLSVFRQKWDLNLGAAQLPPSRRVTRQMDALMLWWMNWGTLHMC